ncbi:hypothetical protein ILUMI_15380 [Ignelater luminosus]|uniref:Uncharacterized protein n=1 Tax=Ignelater luminosus TaxID=2038154 RepID=A0A8K0CU76_IGNLU|nr:hypothetical protein ILUMI_15380 [Ignelater luminosus]
MNRWKEYFKDLLKDDVITEDKNVETQRPNNSEALQEDSPYISKDELDNAISKIKMGKAPEEDEITGKIVKYLQDELNSEKKKLQRNGEQL